MTETELPAPQLDLSNAAANAQFETLQRKLIPLWESIRGFDQGEQTIVVVPSIDVDIALNGSLLQAYEERFLFMLLLLRQPRARLIYVTSQMIHPAIVEYYLGLLPGVIPGQARKRLFLVSPLDASVRSLSLKLLERPRLLEQIRDLIPDCNRAHLVPYNTTEHERDLAIQLGIPMFGADPKYSALGTKTGCRQLFAGENIAHPIGSENLHTFDEVVTAMEILRTEKSDVAEVLVKLNEGVSGEGNALVNLENADAKPEIENCVRAMQPEAASLDGAAFLEKLAIRGGVVEERITGEEFRSPSVQLRVTPLGEVEVLSTHDQLLGGATGQAYLGCRFPAGAEYSLAIMREAEKVGKRLASEGVLGRFAIDFVAARSPSKGETAWRIFAIEINLRKGGTTHPFLTLQFLTDGSFDPQTGIFSTPLGKEKYFVATDHLESPLLRAFTAEDIFEIAARHNLHFDSSRQTGAVFHMLSALGENGRVGFTAVGDSPEDADEIYARVARVLNEEAQAAVGLKKKVDMEPAEDQNGDFAI